MLAELKALDPTTTGVVVAIIVSHAGAMFSAYVSIISRLTRIETRLDLNEKDINGLGFAVGTPRAMAQSKEPPKA